MQNQTTENLLKFPCEYPLKVIGKKTDTFEVAILQIFHQFVPDLKEDCLKTSPSKKNNYVSVTVTFTARSKEQLDRLYSALNASDLVLMTL